MTCGEKEVADYYRLVGKTILEKDSLAMEGMGPYCKDRLLLNIDVAHLETPLINITTGLIAPNDVNVHRCRQVGEKFLEAIAGKRPTECKFKKIDYSIQSYTSKARSPCNNSCRH